MSNIKPFLVPKPQDYSSDIRNPSENEFANSFRSPFIPDDNIKLSDEQLESMHYACLDDATKMIKHFGPQLDEQQDNLKQHIKVLEYIANTAKLQADNALSQLHISQEQIKLHKEQVESLDSIAQDAKSQADTARKELDIMKAELRLAQDEAAGAKQDAHHSKIVAWIAIIISIFELMFPYIFG